MTLSRTPCLSTCPRTLTCATTTKPHSTPSPPGLTDGPGGSWGSGHRRKPTQRSELRHLPRHHSQSLRHVDLSRWCVDPLSPPSLVSSPIQAQPTGHAEVGSNGRCPPGATDSTAARAPRMELGARRARNSTIACRAGFASATGSPWAERWACSCMWHRGG